MSKINIGDMVYVRKHGSDIKQHFHAKVVQIIGPQKFGVKGLRYYGFDEHVTYVFDNEIELMEEDRQPSPAYEAWRLASRSEQEVAELAEKAVIRVWNNTPEADRLNLTRSDYLRAASNALLQAAQPSDQ